jgi:hypothetical protein
MRQRYATRDSSACSVSRLLYDGVCYGIEGIITGLLAFAPERDSKARRSAWLFGRVQQHGALASGFVDFCAKKPSNAFRMRAHGYLAFDTCGEEDPGRRRAT